MQCNGHLWTPCSIVELVHCTACDPPQKHLHFSWKNKVAGETTTHSPGGETPTDHITAIRPWFPLVATVGLRLICCHYIIYTKCHGSLINISGLFPNNFSIQSWWKQAVSTLSRNTLLMARVTVWTSGLPGESPSGNAGSKLHSWSWSGLGERWPLFQEDDDALFLWGT